MENKGDLISRKALYDKIAELEADVRKKLLSTPRDSEAYIRYVERLNERSVFNQEIMAAPTVEVPQWIPCIERLPKIEEEPSEYAKDVGRTFLVTYKDGFVCECVFWKNVNKFDEDVVAWMPLPEPYKGE